ncbi:hypothetical protein FPOA_13578 [Fusarium poae]|uniref:Uncharacterized protein n=1 Tax=Fusarium poae TaxID=36050 RepID=A0A1B8A592_FUSPO|nr:hypothetical protein FPOA_13578 [Fusarium poae]
MSHEFVRVSRFCAQPSLLGWLAWALRAHMSQRVQDLSRDFRVPGVQMATGGDLHSLRKTSIPELLGICISPRGSVEELDSVTEGNAEAETTLVRQQSTVRGHHEDGKDSTGDDNGSGEEENKSYDD